MKVEISHHLEVIEAVRRMKALTAYWREKYGIEPAWTTARATLSGAVLGRAVNATIAVDEQAISLEGPDPGVLLRRAAVAYFTGKLEEYLRADPRGNEAAPQPPVIELPGNEASGSRPRIPARGRARRISKTSRQGV